MYTLKKTFTFEAGHALIHHDGKCKAPHGHSYKLTLILKGFCLISEGPKKNMVLDFGDVKAVANPMIKKYLDHQWLNDTLNTDSPTSEWICKWIYDHLKPSLPLLDSVYLQETHSSCVEYRP